MSEELVATAMVGTDRRGGAGDAPAGELLDRAAVLAVARRAGVTPVTGLPVPGPPEPDAGRPVPEVAGLRLATLLALTAPGGPWGELRSDLLGEWLRLAQQGDRRVPAEYLPALLETGRRDRDLHALIAGAGGARARWLADQRPEWRYLTGGPETDEDAWADGTLAQRVAYLAARRERDPAGGRELLCAEWEGLSPEERTALLGTLHSGLSTGDEPFLEGVLDDRRREVRGVAADLLAGLPGSTYRGRMAARARACLAVHPDRVVVDPPDDCDAAMRRDGIAAKPPAGVGPRAWWLEELLARTDLAEWPADLLARRIPPEWAGALQRGLTRAAVSQRDAGWAATLLDPLGAALGRDAAPADRLLVESLYPVLAPAERQARTVAAVRDPSPTPPVGLDLALSACPGPWGGELSEAVLERIARYARAERRTYHLENLCLVAAARLPAGTAPRVAALAERLAADWPETLQLGPVRRLAETLMFRHEMTEEFA